MWSLSISGQRRSRQDKTDFVYAKIRNSDDAISLATCETMDEANGILKDAVNKIQEETEED